MAPYLGLNMVLVVLWLLSKTNVEKNNICVGKYILCTMQNAIQGCSFLVMALFMGARGAFTSDHNNYIELFRETIQRTFFDIVTNPVYTETGYIIFNKVVGFMTNNANYFMCIESIIFIAIIIAVANKIKCEDYLLFDLLFIDAGIYFQAFNMVRQALAAGVIFIALKLLGDRNVKGYIFFVILATTIHTSSIIMLAVLPLLLLRINIQNAMKMIAIGMIVTLSIDKLIEIVQHYKYANYPYGMTNGTINAFLVQWTICLFTIIAVYVRKIDIEDTHNIVFVNSMWLYIIFSIATLKVYQMSRICYFFSTPMLFLASNAIGGWKGKSGMILRIGMVALLVLYSYAWLSGTGYDPYYTFLVEV